MVRKYVLALKYWLQGDDWKTAVAYANRITLFIKYRGEK